MPGPLFNTQTVQKILKKAEVLGLFRPWIKYPRTLHVPWSKSIQNDDRIMSSTEKWNGINVVVSEKMDGENTTMYRNYIHARSTDSSNHQSRSWVKSFWSSIKHEIPEGWRICGENCYAIHSIEYKELENYFLGFSIWNDKQECLSWNDTKEWFELLGITSVPVLYCGKYDEKKIQELWNANKNLHHEGYVIRPENLFSFMNFSQMVGKFVRPNHVQTDKHWTRKIIIPNSIKLK